MIFCVGYVLGTSFQGFILCSVDPWLLSFSSGRGPGPWLLSSV